MDDVFAVIGFGSIAAGLSFIHWPTALVVCGSILLILGVLGARHDIKQTISADS